MSASVVSSPAWEDSLAALTWANIESAIPRNFPGPSPRSTPYSTTQVQVSSCNSTARGTSESTIQLAAVSSRPPNLYLSNLHSIELTHHGDSLEELLSLLLRVLDGHNTHSNPILRQVVVEVRREWPRYLQVEDSAYHGLEADFPQLTVTRHLPAVFRRRSPKTSSSCPYQQPSRSSTRVPHALGAWGSPQSGTYTSKMTEHAPPLQPA